ncbi:envelope stress sensor histidine kinase CpxA [Vibrio zhugei]|uniref:histidine kinase n=1 Tax=Vibrio zhugei TaxID=2479546 RepID=A0ABV7C9F1_9VIBR|nr:envelope stress sensor histidine kinase CpxA [Vibrio zhugei]
MPKFNSLYARIFAIFWLTIAIIVVGVLAIPNLDPRKSKEIPSDMYQSMLDARDMIENRYAYDRNLTFILQDLDRHRIQPHRDRNRPDFFITTQSGKILSGRIASSETYRALKNFTSSIDYSDEPTQRAYGKYRISGPIPIILAQQPLLLFVGFDWNGPPPFVIHLLDHPIQLLLVIMLISTPLLLWLAWALSKPAQYLAQAANRVARGNFIPEPELEKGPDEFRVAGRSFNQMVQAVNTMISGQQRLLSDISHELRSPLTRLRMATGLAVRKQGSSSELERIDTEAQRLEQMISELLELSRVQTDSHLQRETQPLTSLWEELLDDAQFEAEQLNKTLSFNAIPDVPITGSPKLLMSALENIVRNAIKYGHSQVQVHFQLEDLALTVTVEDDGPGVPSLQLRQIFRPFYRVSEARDRDSGGTGLGLAITESAIRQHNGQIVAKESQLGGLLITFTLPIDA